MFSEFFELIGGRHGRGRPLRLGYSGHRHYDYTFVYIAFFIIFFAVVLVWAFYPKTNTYTITTTSLTVPSNFSVKKNNNTRTQ